MKGLRDIASEHPGVGRRIVVRPVADSRTTEHGMEILGVADFVNVLLRSPGKRHNARHELSS